MMAGSVSIKEFANLIHQTWVWWTSELVVIYDSLFIFNQKQPVKIRVDADEKVTLVTETEVKNTNKKKALISVPSRHVMYKTIRLPLNTRKNLKQVIEYEFDKYFPLNIKDTYFDCKILKTSETNSLNVGIWAIRKNYLSKLINKIQFRFGLTIKEATVVNAQWQALITIGNVKENRQSDAANEKSSIPYYGYIVTSLILLCLVTPLLKMQNYNKNLEVKIKVLEEEAKDIIALKNNISVIENRLNELVKSKNTSPSVTELWSELTKIISGNGYVNHVRYYENNINLEGKANSVEKIVKLLKQNERFSEISIDAPVRRLEQGRFESMNISFKVSNDN